MAYKITKDRVEEVLGQISETNQYEVLVGIPAEHAARVGSDKGSRSDNAITNVALAYIHEFGSPAQNIPARPHMVPGVEAAKDQITVLSRNALASALQGNKGALLQGLNQIGIVTVGSIQQKIASGPFTPLKPQTIKRKGSTKPLIDTGAYRQSISYVVRPKGAS
jgi:hypothetical protein